MKAATAAAGTKPYRDRTGMQAVEDLADILCYEYCHRECIGLTAWDTERQEARIDSLKAWMLRHGG